MNLFNKYPHPVNFNFADSYHGGVVTIAGHPFELHTAEAGADIHHVVVSHHQVWSRDSRNERLRRLDSHETEGERRTRLEISESAGMRLRSPGGKTLSEAEAGGWLGVSEKRWLFRFGGRSAMRFYGLGEKHTADLL